MARTDLNGVSDISSISAEEIDSIGNAKGEAFRRDVKTSQLRNVYSAINGIRVLYQQKRDYDPDIERRLILLKPKLAYAAGRNNKLKSFRTFMVEAIDGVVKSECKIKALENFFALLEAVVAYHKFHGGKEN